MIVEMQLNRPIHSNSRMVMATTCLNQGKLTETLILLLQFYNSFNNVIIILAYFN